MRSPGTPAALARRYSPPETTSIPAPRLPRVFRTATFDSDLMAKHTRCGSGRQRLGEKVVVPGQRGGGIDVERRAHSGGDVGDRHVFGMQGAVSVKEMVHASSPGLSAPSYPGAAVVQSADFFEEIGPEPLKAPVRNFKASELGLRVLGLFVGGFADLMRGVEVHGGDDQTHHDVGPDRGVGGRDQTRGDDADISEGVVAGREERGAGERAFGLAVPRRGEARRSGSPARAPRPTRVKVSAIGGSGMHAAWRSRVQRKASRGDQKECGQSPCLPGRGGGAVQASAKKIRMLIGGVFQEIRAIGEERDRARAESRNELHPEIGEIQRATIRTV